MPSLSPTLSQKLADLISQIYPDLDADILASQVVEAFWPDAAPRRKRARAPGNRLWSSKDAMVITYGYSIQDGKHKPLDVLHDFLE